MGKQIPIYALKEDAYNIIQYLSVHFPDLVRYDYHRGYLNLYDEAQMPNYYFLAQRIPISPDDKDNFWNLNRIIFELAFNDFVHPQNRPRSFAWRTGRIYLCTWYDLPANQIELYTCAMKYIKKESFKFKDDRRIIYVLPHAAELILRLQQDAQDPEYGKLPDELTHVELIPPKSSNRKISAEK